MWGTTSREHPGVDRFLNGGERAIAGPVRLLQHSTSLIPGAFDLDPARVRAEIARRGWKTVTGFQTRNLGHRAHERLQKTALELTDGLLIHPLIGWKKPGDMLPEVILDGYSILIDRYYPKERVILAALTTAMRYAGPREAVFPRSSGRTSAARTSSSAGTTRASAASTRSMPRTGCSTATPPAELGIVPLLLHGPCWCDVCQEVVTEKTCPHGEAAWKDISGTEVRAMLARGERPPAFFMRPEIADFLIERGRREPLFF